MKHTYLIFIFSILVASSTAQVVDSARIYSTNPVRVYSTSPVSIWGNLSNNGTLSTEEGAQLFFYGDVWSNQSSATLPGGGVVRFTKPRPFPYSNSVAQTLNGGGAGASFPDILVNNPNNLNLSATSTYVRDTVWLVGGKVVHNLQNFTVGNGNAGTILGYNENRYFVTNGSPTDTSQGYLQRLQVGTAAVDFPIGPNTGKYTPASLTNNGTLDAYRVRAFDGVYGRAFFDSLQNYKTVGTTWQVLESVAGGSDVLLNLQHNAADEGSLYNRSSQYIARYIGTNHNTAGGASSRDSYWDLVPNASTTGNSAVGTITTGSPIATAFVASRQFNTNQDFTDYTFFTKSPINNPPLPVTLISYQAAWQQEDARLFWQTASEKNADRFILLRSFDGINFTEIGSVPCRNLNTTQAYEYFDLGVKPKTLKNVYYQLKQVDYDGTVASLGVRVLFVTPKSNLIMGGVYPNPASDVLNIRFYAASSNQLTLSIIDSRGRLVKQINQSVLSGDQTLQLEVGDLAQAVYTLRITSGDSFVGTERIIITR